jgi:hypothetical protein
MSNEDPEGYAIFDSFAGGYLALLYDLQVKCSGSSSHRLTPSSTLLDLVKVYAPAGDSNDPGSYAANVVWWLNHALTEEYEVNSTLVEIVGVLPAPSLKAEGV